VIYCKEFTQENDISLTDDVNTVS